MSFAEAHQMSPQGWNFGQSSATPQRIGSALAEPTAVSAATARSAASRFFNVALSMKYRPWSGTSVGSGGPGAEGRPSYAPAPEGLLEKGFDRVHELPCAETHWIVGREPRLR